MASESEPKKQQKRRATNTGSYEPDPLIMSHKPRPDVDTEQGYSRFGDHFDEGMTGPTRSSTSVVRYTSDGIPRQRPASSQTASVPVTPRRQTTTRDVPSQRPATQTGRQAQQTTMNRQPRQARMAAPLMPEIEKIRQRVEIEQPPVARKKVHWLLPVGVGMLFMLVVFVLGNSLLTWGTAEYDMLRYGNPPITQTDAIVGHNNDSLAHESHFLVINYRNSITVIELMAGDPNKSVSYSIPSYQDNASAPATLDFKDVTGDGKPDMIIHVQGINQPYVLINTGTEFRFPNNSDHIQGI